MNTILGDRIGSCCSYCGSRDHGYETCDQISVNRVDSVESTRNNAGPSVEPVLDCQVDPFAEKVPGHAGFDQSGNFQCSVCGTLRLEIPESCDDLTVIHCSTCGRSMGIWRKVKRDFSVSARAGVFSLEHGQFLRVEEFRGDGGQTRRAFAGCSSPEPDASTTNQEGERNG